MPNKQVIVYNELVRFPLPVGFLFTSFLRPVRLAYQPPASSTFLSEQTSQIISQDKPIGIPFFLRNKTEK
jgi:hypothetical protein